MQKNAENNEHLLNQLVRLGDMMGDGLHNESDGKWISKEYRHISKILFPDEHKAQRRESNSQTDSLVAKVISERSCPDKDCGGTLKQTRKGAKVVFCTKCSKRYKLINKNL